MAKCHYISRLVTNRQLRRRWPSYLRDSICPGGQPQAPLAQYLLSEPVFFFFLFLFLFRSQLGILVHDRSDS